MNAALELAKPRAELRLDFGCGQHPKEGFDGVDLYAPDATHKVDLWKFPLPWEDASVDEIHSSHFVEHLPAREVELRDLRIDYRTNPTLNWESQKKVREEREEKARIEFKRFIGQDFFFAFFDECFRILKPGGTMTVVVPALKTHRAFQDPTHRRFITGETFAYLNAEWRKQQGLDHYRVTCDFAGDVNPIVPQELNLRHPEAAQRMLWHEWNTMVDLHALLIKRAE